MERDWIVKVLLAERSKLIAYAWSLVRDAHMAEDIFQDLIVKAIDRYEEIEHPSSVPGWARRVVHNLSVDNLRRRKLSPVQLADDVLAMLEENWDRVDSLETEERYTALRQCISRLTPGVQQLLALRYTEGFSGKEIARRLGRKPDTVYMALSRAYAKLYQCICQH